MADQIAVNVVGLAELAPFQISKFASLVSETISTPLIVLAQ